MRVPLSPQSALAPPRCRTASRRRARTVELARRCIGLGLAYKILDSPVPADISKKIHAGQMLDDSAYERLVQSVVDYAIFMLDLDGRVVSWNAGARAHQGLFRRRDHRRAFFALLHARGGRRRRSKRALNTARETRAAFTPKAGECARTAAGFGRAWSLTRFWQDGSHCRFCQDHARYHRKPRSRACDARGRAPFPHPGAGRDRLRDLYAQPRGRRHQLEHRRGAH